MPYDGPHYATGSCVGNHRCDRPECRTALQRHRKHQIAARARNGGGDVPARAARAHIVKLHRAGMLYKEIAAAAGVHLTAVMRIVDGRRNVRAGTERAILAVQVVRPGRVDGTVPWRQMRALVALGYPIDWIRRTAHLGPGITASSTPHPILRKCADKIEALAEEIGDTPGPSEKARRYACERGWQVPAMYDAGWQVPERPEPETPAERREAQAELAVTLYRQRISIREISWALTREYGELGSSERAVNRYVAAAGLEHRIDRATG